MIKGINLTTTVSFIEEEFGESAKEAWLEGLDDETRHAFQYALASSWYPLELFWTNGLNACRRFAPDRLIEVVRKWGQHSAKTQLTGIYRLLLKLGSPNMMLSAAPKMWGTFNNEGTISAPVNEKGHGVVKIEGMSLRDPLFGENLSGWIEETIRLTGIKNVTTTVIQSPRDDKNFYELSISWS